MHASTKKTNRICINGAIRNVGNMRQLKCVFWRPKLIFLPRTKSFQERRSYLSMVGIRYAGIFSFAERSIECHSWGITGRTDER